MGWAWAGLLVGLVGYALSYEGRLAFSSIKKFNLVGSSAKTV